MKAFYLGLFICLLLFSGLTIFSPSIVDARVFSFFVALFSSLGIILLVFEGFIIPVWQKIKKGNKKINVAVFILSPEDCEKYAGEYVCIPSFDSFTVVGHDKDPTVARKMALEQGYAYPVICYIQNAGERFCYAFDKR